MIIEAIEEIIRRVTKTYEEDGYTQGKERYICGTKCCCYLGAFLLGSGYTEKEIMTDSKFLIIQEFKNLDIDIDTRYSIQRFIVQNNDRGQSYEDISESLKIFSPRY